MNTRICLGHGLVCVTAGSFCDADNKENVYVGLKFQPLKQALECGASVTDASLIDDSQQTFIKIDNESGLQSLERAVARMRYEFDKFKNQADGVVV